MKYIEFDKDRELDVIAIGRAAIDFNPIYTSELKEEFKPLKKVKYFEKYIGGSPANISIGLNRHGLKVGFISKVSQDQFGDFVLDYLEEEGIDTTNITRTQRGYNLGLTFTEMLSESSSNILMYREQASDLELGVEDVNEDYIKSSKALLVSGTALSKSPSREAVLKSVILAKKVGTKIIFDIDYRDYSWSNLEETAIYYSMVAEKADVILGSRKEFDIMEKLILSSKNDKNSANYWFKKGVSILIIKHGADGSIAFTKDGKKVSVNPFFVDARKNFGGGDGYASGFIYGLFNGWELDKCLTFASAEASMMIQSNNCSDSLPNENEVNDFIKRYEEM